MSTRNDQPGFLIRPADVLLFRDGRPFSAGDDHRASGLFPPPPTTFYGALRAAAFARHGARFDRDDFGVQDDDLVGEMGTKTSTGAMTITHFSLAHAPVKDDGTLAVEPLFPLPADVLKLKPGSNAPNGTPEWLRVVPTAFNESDHKKPQPRTNLPPGSKRLLWQPRDERAWYEDTSGYVAQDAFARYLLDGTPPMPFEHPCLWEDADEKRSAYATEPRTSLEITNANRTAEDGRLYTVEFTRANADVGFLLRLEHASSLGTDKRWLRLGGESRATTLEDCTIPAFPRVDDIKVRVKAKAGKRFTVVLATPAPFTYGWMPDGINPDDGTGTLGSCDVQLMGAALGRSQHLGGWDLVRNRPYLTRRTVPPGSVYFFEITNGDPDVDRLFEDCFGCSLCTDPDDRKRGLGIAYLGTWKPQPEDGHA